MPTYNASDCPKTIYDVSTVTSTITVATGIVMKVTVTLDIGHTFDGDLVATLTSPTSTTVTLFSRIGGGGDDFDMTVFDDAASTPIASGSAPFNGSYQPQQALSAFIGEEGGGDWTLSVSDQAGGDTGTLYGWSLTIATTSWEGSGGVVFDGQADRQAEYIDNGSGGAVFAGNASVALGCNYTSQGGVALAGQSEQAATYITTGAGSMQLPGTSARQATYIPVAGSTVFHNGFRYRKSITIPAGTVQEDLTNFPVFVSLDLAGKITAYDFDFEDEQQTYLHYDIDSLTDGTLKAWVIVPTVKANEATRFFVYYNKPEQLTSLESNGWAEYVNVYHLNGTYEDAAGTNDGTGCGDITDTTGEFSGAIQLAGDGYVALGDDGIEVYSPLTVSAWIKIDPDQVQDRVVYSRGSGICNFSLGYDFNGKVFARVTTNEYVEHETKTDTTLTPGSWYHVAATWTPQAIDIQGAMLGAAYFPMILGYYEEIPAAIPGSLSIFINGVLDKTGDVVATALASSSSAYIGRQYHRYTFSGCVDELRVAVGTKKPAWIKAEYDTATASYSLGAENSAFNFSGSSVNQATYIGTGSGQLLFSGSSTRFVTFSKSGIGQLALAGQSTSQATYRKAGAGSMVFGGHGQRDVVFSRMGSGGVALAGQSQRATTYIKTGSGGVGFSGIGETIFNVSRSSSGGIIIAGDSVRQATYKYTTMPAIAPPVQMLGSFGFGLAEDPEALPAIAFGGTAENTSNRNYNGSGRVQWGGIGASQADYIPSSSGQIRFNGHSRATPGFPQTGSGGMVFAGDSARQATYKYTTMPAYSLPVEMLGSFGFGLAEDPEALPAIAFNGVATTQADYLFAGQGGLVFSGNSMLSTFYPKTGGGMVFAGQSTEEAAYNVIGSGAIVFRSAPVNNLLGNVTSFPAFSGTVKTLPGLHGTITPLPSMRLEAVKTFPSLQGSITPLPSMEGKVVCNRSFPAFCQEYQLVH